MSACPPRRLDLLLRAYQRSVAHHEVAGRREACRLALRRGGGRLGIRGIDVAVLVLFGTTTGMQRRLVFIDGSVAVTTMR